METFKSFTKSVMETKPFGFGLQNVTNWIFELTNKFFLSLFWIQIFGVTRFPPSNCDLYLPANNTINLEIKKPLISS